MNSPKRFRNRSHAGKQLAQALASRLQGRDALVLALPRGGVPVGCAIAQALHLPLDILMVRKLPLPGHPEYAMGAVANGGVRVLNAALDTEVPAAVIEAACERELALITQRERRYRGARPPPVLEGRTAVLVDDGLATGSTMRAAIAVARAGRAASIIVAVPVAPPATCAALVPEVEALVCLQQPPAFLAVSEAYRHFEQTSDEEVQDLLAIAWNSTPRAAALTD